MMRLFWPFSMAQADAQADARAAQIGNEIVEREAYKIANLRDKSAWAALLTFVDEAIEADAEAGETTGVVVAASANWVCGAHVGDSEAWLISNGEVETLTRGHRKPYLGYGGACPRAFEAKWNGTLIVASDGLFKYASPETIAQIVRANDDLEIAVDALVETTRYSSGDLPDDVSIILCRNAANASSTKPKARRWWKRG